MPSLVRACRAAPKNPFWLDSRPEFGFRMFRYAVGPQIVKITEKYYAPWVKTRQDALDKVLERVAVEESA